MQIQLALVLCLCVGYGFALKLPQSFQRCKVGPELDNKPNECLRSAIEDSMHQLAVSGNAELGVNDIDPMLIKEVLIEQGETSPIAIKLQFTDNDLIGLSDVKVHSVSGKLSSPKGFELVIKCTVDRLQLVGGYSVDGKILVLPIKGIGKSNMTIMGANTKVVIKGEPQTKHGKEYLKITDLQIDMKTSRLHTQLDNLFNGDKALGDNMNKFLNENWEDIFQELKPSVEKAFAAIFQGYAKRILERVQYKHIFLTE